ncbi:MAG: molybdopterin-dependent oxidoreductase, partial [Chloroflexi bacterium]|nr:molybdopterin-dependent oxidoreductase [Chloroflexota bacterium]
CIDVCPTGGLVERDNKWEKAVKTITTTCPHCPVGCQLKLEVNKRNKVIRAIPDRHAPANHGQACFKGKFGLDFVNNRKERLSKPLVRREGVLEEASWPEALDLVAESLGRYKGDQYALIASPRGTNEDNYVAQKFARAVMGTNNVDVSSNLRPELTRPLGELLGRQAGTNCTWELESSASFLVVSSNITEEQNVAAVPIKKAVQEGASLVVIDQRETELTRHASIWLRPRPGTEASLIGGMLRVFIDEALDDHEFVSSACTGLDELRNNLSHFDLLRVERITGVSHEQIQSAARLFAARRPGAVLYALETVAPELREEVVQALVNVVLITGNIGKPSTGLYPLFTGANEQGSKDVGCHPVALPGYRSFDNEDAVKRFREAWGVDLTTSKGLSIREITEAMEDGRVKALQVIGDSPNFTNGEIGDFIDALDKLEFLVVQDTFPSELTEKAHVVLPTVTFADREGTYTNMERRVQMLRPALGPKGDEDEDWRIICQIARRMGASGFEFDGPEAVFDEFNDLWQAYGGVTYERLRVGDGLQWPCQATDMADSPILYGGGFQNRKAILSPMSLNEAPEFGDEEYPLMLARGRVLNLPTGAVEIGNADGRNQISRDHIIEIHEEDAARMGVSAGEWIDVVHARGAIRGIARLTAPYPGLVATTYLFGEMITDIEGSKAPDPMLKVPTLPMVPARLEKVAVQAAAD